jgi:hypothetical protein
MNLGVNPLARLGSMLGDDMDDFSFLDGHKGTIIQGHSLTVNGEGEYLLENCFPEKLECASRRLTQKHVFFSGDAA